MPMIWSHLYFFLNSKIRLEMNSLFSCIVVGTTFPDCFYCWSSVNKWILLVLISSHDCNNSSQSLQRISLLIWNKYKVKYHILLTQLLIRNEWNFWGKNPFFLVFLSFCTIIHIDICKDKMMKNITTSVTQGHDMHII